MSFQRLLILGRAGQHRWVRLIDWRELEETFLCHHILLLLLTNKRALFKSIFPSCVARLSQNTSNLIGFSFDIFLQLFYCIISLESLRERFRPLLECSKSAILFGVLLVTSEELSGDSASVARTSAVCCLRCSKCYSWFVTFSEVSFPVDFKS